MKITGIEIKNYVIPLEPPFRAAWDTKPRTKFSTTLVFVYTDEGVTGIGSGDLMYGFKGHEYLFIGKDPFDIETHNQHLDNIDFHYGRCWPLDIALWDLMGKAVNKPTYKLLGGKTDRVLAYASCGEMIDVEERIERTHRLIEMGFKAMKIRFHNMDDVSKDIKLIEELRKAVGNKIEIMVDANQGWRMAHDIETPWDLKKAYQVAKELEKLDVYWLEEPLPHWDLEGMARLREMTGIRIAGGELNRRTSEYTQLCARGCLDVYQPDVTVCGGITGVKKIATMVKAFGAAFSPHTWSNGIGLIANLHLCCGIGDVSFLELPFDPPAWTPERRDFVQTKESYTMIDKNGYLRIKDKPGLGFELDEEVLSRYEIKHDYVW